MTTSGLILALNAGSSSLKFAAFHFEGDPLLEFRGVVGEASECTRLIVRDRTGAEIIDRPLPEDEAAPFATAIGALLSFVDERFGSDALKAVGHRVVHGGVAHSAPAFVTPGLLSDLQALTSLDPLHMPRNIQPMLAVASARPDLLQVACFDTAFHRTMPAVARAFALPRSITDAGVRRYGFHGLSFDYIAERLLQIDPVLARKRVLVAHLGSGGSLCAMRDNASIAVSTGFSALDGLVMATRCGSLDPGVLLYLYRTGHSPADVENMLYRQSGLLGVSGISGDIRVLLDSSEAHAREAVDLFVYRFACEAAGMVAALEGLDVLVFTAGIGEHSAAIRAAACSRLHWLGIRLDAAANEAGERRISAPDSAVDVLVIATDEEVVIARQARMLMKEV